MNKFKLILNRIKKTKAAKIYRKIRTIVKEVYNRTLSDDYFLNKEFLKRFGKTISKENPQTFNEKIQWLKLYWRDPIAEKCADKYQVREYVKNKGLSIILNELIEVYDNVEEINLDILPNKFVLKCTHGSGCNIICKDKNQLDWKDTKKKLSSWMKKDYYLPSREWVYKNLDPRIICERYLDDRKSGELIDYKFFCFNGSPEYIMTGTDRFSVEGLKVDFFDVNFVHLDFTRDHPMKGYGIEKPKNLDKMIWYSKILSSDFPFARVDFYEVNEKIYFGELTFFPGGGFEKFQPEEYDYLFGQKLNLDNIINREMR